MFVKIVVLFLAISVVSAKIQDQDDLIVEIPNGKIRGHILETDTGAEYYAFQEIPYALPPVGNLRFKEPVPAKNWDGILDVTNNTKFCYQFGGFPDVVNSTKENEDCLYLNVYTPKLLPSGALKPVFVFIHGGGFFAGDGTYETFGPDYFINHDIIVVTFNYRLGALGFLSTEDNVIPGNNGLKDQNLALKWVHDNIRLFGGNNSRITIGGESAGAASVGLHLLSPKSSGLFSAAVLQSGSAISSWVVQDQARKRAFSYGALLDPNFSVNSSSHELLELLMKTPAEKLKFSIVTESESTQLAKPTNGWFPVIESTSNSNAFITEAMYESLRTGNFSQVPTLLGFNSEESVFSIKQPETLQATSEAFDNDVTNLCYFDVNINTTDLKEFGAQMKSIYTQGRFQDSPGATIRVLSDASFTTSIVRQAEIQSQYTDVYLYQLSYWGELGQNYYYVEGAEKVQHAADLQYFWRTKRNFDLNQFSKEDVLAQKRLVTLWSNFVIYNNPTPFEDDLLNNVTWPKVSASNLSYLNINGTLEPATNPRYYKKIAGLIDMYGNRPFVTY